jgi:hypothetical protein
MNAHHAVLVGLAGLGVLWVILGIASSFNLKKLVCGADNTLSTSKFQFVVWTVVIVFSYIVMFAYHGKVSNFALLNFPTNVLIVMGLSATTAVAAKGIAVNAAATQAKAQGVAITPGLPIRLPGDIESLAGLFQADDGTPDLGKVQLMVWTFVGIAVYITLLHHKLASHDRTLPEIDSALMALMGLGHGAYLGKKMASNGGS